MQRLLIKTDFKKEVPLRGRKKHTARRVASVGSAVLSVGSNSQGVPQSRLGVSGYPSPVLALITWVPHQLGQVTRDLGKNLGLGYPFCGQTHICENSTFPVLRLRTVINMRD